MDSTKTNSRECAVCGRKFEGDNCPKCGASYAVRLLVVAAVVAVLLIAVILL